VGSPNIGARHAAIQAALPCLRHPPLLSLQVAYGTTAGGVVEFLATTVVQGQHPVPGSRFTRAVLDAALKVWLCGRLSYALPGMHMLGH
jgi:hypothetical protein